MIAKISPGIRVRVRFSDGVSIDLFIKARLWLKIELSMDLFRKARLWLGLGSGLGMGLGMDFFRKLACD